MAPGSWHPQSRFPSPTWRGHEQQTTTAAEYPLGSVAPFVAIRASIDIPVSSAREACRSASGPPAESQHTRAALSYPSANDGRRLRKLPWSGPRTR